MCDHTFAIQSIIHSDRDTLWRHVTQMRNVNAELWPYVRMTYPVDRAKLAGRDVPAGVTILTSVILLFSVLPVDLHFLRFDRIDDSHGFYENSVTAMHTYWRHTRTLTDTDGGVVVRDEVHFSTRLPLIGYTLLPVYRFVFRHRHKRLRAVFTL